MLALIYFLKVSTDGSGYQLYLNLFFGTELTKMAKSVIHHLKFNLLTNKFSRFFLIVCVLCGCCAVHSLFNST